MATNHEVFSRQEQNKQLIGLINLHNNCLYENYVLGEIINQLELCCYSEEDRDQIREYRRERYIEFVNSINFKNDFIRKFLYFKFSKLGINEATQIKIISYLPHY